MNCLLTGGTGIVGSHIIFEWLHKTIVDKTVNHLFLVIRNTKNICTSTFTQYFAR